MLKKFLRTKPAFLLLIPAFVILAIYLYPGKGPGLQGFTVLDEPTALVRLNKDLRSPTNRPTLYYISAKWCFECPQFERDVLSSSGVKETLRGYTTFKMDATADPGIWPALNQFNIDSVPTLIVHDTKGIRILRASGMLPPSAVTSFLRQK
ncbi:MAG: thioredoxin fold domain-containing protein [Spirochaetia bacterium]|nr:thioredoxin fold domain-containing protein [Spirochaetia bacterium]